MLGWTPAPNRLISIINDMPQDDFENLTKKLLGEMRFKITKENISGKYLEYEATREGDADNRVFLIRAARGSKPVTPEELQATVGKRSGGKEMSPVFISTSGFTEEAGKYADMLNISIADGEKLDLLLKNYSMADDIQKNADKRMLEKDGDRFLPSIDELENNMKWGNDFYASGNFKKAIEYYDSAIRLKSQYDLAWLMKGNAMNSLGWHDEAIECFKKVLEYNPQSEEAWYNLGATLYNLGRYDDELACYDKALEIKPDYTKAWNNKGATLHQLGKFEEAVMCYDRVLKLEPDNISVLNNRGVALKNLGDHDEALKSFDRALRKSPEYIDAWLNKGILLHDMERFADAITCYDYVLGRWKSPEVLCQRGVALSNLGKYRQAIENFDESLKLKPGWQVAITEKEKAELALKEESESRAKTHREIAAKPAAPAPPVVSSVPVCRNCSSKLEPEAIFCSRCGVAVDPGMEPAIIPAGKPVQLEAIEDEESLREALEAEETLLQKSRMLRSLGKNDQALKAVEGAMGIADGIDVWLEMGHVLGSMGRTDEAIEAYDHVLKLQPENLLALGNKEIILSSLGKLDDALAVNDFTVGSYPEDPHAWTRRSNIMRRMGKLKDSVECLDRVTELMPDLAEVWNAQGVALLELGKHDDAITCLDRAIQIDPDFSDAWNNKGAAVLASGDMDKSLNYFDRAIDTNPDNHRAWANKAAALQEMERFDEALECLEEAFTMSRDKRLLNSRGWALLSLDRIDDSISAFDEAIGLDQDYAEAWNNRGLAYSRKEDLTEAYDSFDRALAIVPDFEDARKNRDATAKRIEHLAGKPPEKPVNSKPASSLAKAVAEAEAIEAEGFKCPFCAAIGSIDDVFCEKCGQKFTRTMKEDAAEEKLDRILDIESQPAREPERKPAKKTRENLMEDMVTIPGVGYAKAGIIIEAGYDTEAKLRKATVENIGNVPGIGEGLAKKIKRKYK